MKRHLMILICVVALVGCGGTDTTGGEEPATTTAQSNAEDPVATTQPADDQAVGNEAESGGGEAPAGGGGDGPEMVPAGDSEVVINGESATANSLLRCQPFDSSEALGLPEGEDGEVLDLQVLGDGYILFIGLDRARGHPDGKSECQHPGAGCRGGGETGVFEASVRQNGDIWFAHGAEQVDGPFMEWTEGRVIGAATLADTFEAADPIEVTFDVVVPEEVQDCSL